MKVVPYHKDLSYLINWLGLVEVATIEPKPGIPPSAGQLSELLTKLQADPAAAIIITAHTDPKAAEWLSERTKIPVVLLAYTVGGTPQAKDLFSLFDDTHRSPAGGEEIAMDSASLSIVLPALAAGLLVAATHVPLGMQVLARGIVFIDIAIAQTAGVGVVDGRLPGVRAAWPGGAGLGAGCGACSARILLTWTEKRWPEVQEAIIGVVFVLAATAEILLLAGNPQGGEHLKDLLVGQILWVGPEQLGAVAVLTAVVLAVWFGLGAKLGRLGFYLLFGLSVTASVQLVGVYLVFATLIVPALATRNATRVRLAKAWGVAALGYAIGLVLSALYDLPSGPTIVWALAVVGMAGVRHRRPRPNGRVHRPAGLRQPESSGPPLPADATRSGPCDGAG